MDNRNLFLITDISGFTPQIARLVSMMNYVRSTTLSAVEGLGMNALDYLHDSQRNSIGSLLLHIAGTEIGYQAATFYKRDLNNDEKLEWGTAIALGEKARQQLKGQELSYYLDKLQYVRAKTLEELSLRDDQWLEEQTPIGNDRQINNYFKWFHVFGHELNHRGQIRLLRKHAITGNVGN